MDSPRLGFWASALTAATALAALVIAAATAPARSGPNCPPLVAMGVLESCIEYPYTAVATFVPGDYIWMVTALALALLFVVLAATLHQHAIASRRVYTHVAVSFAVVAAAAHTINYSIQLAVVQPSLLRGELEGLALFSQYNPHGIFIALEDLGYFTMGLAFAFLVPAFARRPGLHRAIRVLLLLGSILAVGTLVILVFLHGFYLEYRYEVAAIVIDWITLILLGTLLSIFFAREGRRRMRRR
jgi:hypothetical protein